MKNKIFSLVLTFLLTISTSWAAAQVKVTAMDEFKTDSPTETIRVRVNEDITLGDYELKENNVLKCKVLNVQDPKRGKRSATFFVQPYSIVSDGHVVNIEEEYYGKYSKRVLSIEELKQIPPSSVAKKAVLTVGNHFVKGLSMGVSFAEGVVQNQDDNRVKSGFKQVYKDSPLSYMEKGEQLDILAGDTFYLVFKIADKEDEPNYSYTEPEE